jgi:uncharacterized protein
VQLRDVRERAEYLGEMEERGGGAQVDRRAGKARPDLKARIEAADTKQALEDLYLPTSRSAARGR